MKVLSTPRDMYEWSREQSQLGNSIGFVPTMGALHKGHMALLEQSKAQCDVTVLSIFVNQTQFTNDEDFVLYPRTEMEDLALAELLQVDVVYMPSPESMYPAGYSTSITAGSIAESMEGEFRPGHFAGVATVVVKLLNAVQPTVMFLGQKDFQQVAVLRRIVQDLNFSCSVQAVPTIRAENGLALSSRNSRLSPADVSNASHIFVAMCTARDIVASGETNAEVVITATRKVIDQIDNCVIEYVAIVESNTLTSVESITGEVVICIAAIVGGVRLIDNMVLNIA